MLYFTHGKENCTGCSACFSVCPVKCISMQKDEEGFLYPVASDACINCKKCEKVCPIANAEKIQKKYFRQKAYCALTKDKKIWKRSSSGGAFSEICKAFGDEDTVVCGAAWDGLSVHHICVKGVRNIAPLCKSKYIASSPESVFSEIQDFLQNNKKVIFCGTPCQVAGLKNILNKEYDNLLLIDLICHGVGSPDVFKECVEEMGRQFGFSVNRYEFRAKRNYYQTDYLSKICSDNGKEIYITDDQYIQLFLKQHCLRPSCGQNCKFRNHERQGDMTIADFKGLIKIFPGLIGTKRNYSTIVINTAKGNSVMETIERKMKVFQCEIDHVKKYNPLFFRQTWFSESRNVFFEEFRTNPSETIKTWTSPACENKTRIKRRIFDLAPVFVRRFIIKSKKGN